MRDVGGVKNITGAELAMVLADDTQITVDSSHIRMNGIVLDDSTSTSSEFTIGAAVTGQLTITIMNEDGAYSEYNFRDATAQLTFYGIEDLPEDLEVIPVQTIIIGQYNIVDYTYDGSDITLTAYDNLSKFDFPCTELAGETLTFPITIQDLVIKAARICGVVLASPTNPIPNGSYTITQKPEQWDTMTWHDVISYCAQLGGTFAKADSYGRVYFDWYNINVVHESYDGGTFNTSDTPYSDGDALDGGNFDYDGTEASADGGNFDWPTDMHYVDSPYALTIDTDDVYITGFKVVLKSTDNINADQDTQDYTTALYGTEGYVVTISGNPFIQTTGQADAVRDFLGPIVTGMWFRPMNATIDEDLSIEAGDQAYVTGLNGDTYQCFVSHVTYTVNAATTFSCDAEPNSASQKVRFTASDKLAAHVERVERKLSEVGGIAGNTNQYFWHMETGTDTGAHITEVPQEEWDDPNSQNYHSGGNLLVRSNGIAVRDGLTELAQFGQSVILGQNGDVQADISSEGIKFKDPQNIEMVNIDTGGDTSLVSFSKFFTDSIDAGASKVHTIDSPYTVDVNSCQCRIELWEDDIYKGMEQIGPFQWDTDYSSSQLSGEIQFSFNGTTHEITVTRPSTSTATDATYELTFMWSAYIYQATMTFGHRRSGKSKGAFSSTFGDDLEAKYRNQFVVGRYNKNESSNLFEVGNGTDSNRKNAFSVSSLGEITADGRVTCEGVTSVTPVRVASYDIGSKFFRLLNTPFEPVWVTAYEILDGLIYFAVEIYINGTFISNHMYSIGSVYSTYRPMHWIAGTGHCTDGNFYPTGLASWVIETDGTVKIMLQATGGPYVYMSGMYKYKEYT